MIHGSAFIQPIADLEQCDVLLMFGTNPVVSQSSYVHAIGGTTAYDRILERGGRIVVIDPRRTESAERWAKQKYDYLPLYPGTDIFLLLGLIGTFATNYRPQPHIEGINQWLEWAKFYPLERVAELTHLPLASLSELAQTLKHTRKVSYLLSVGVNQGGFGTACAIGLQVLAYLAGHLDQPGGLLYKPQAKYLNYLLALNRVKQTSRIGNFSAVAGMMPAGILADEILTPGRDQIRALIVVCGNPLTSIPGQYKLQEAFQQLELLVTHDLFVNETGQLAHIRLPATSWLERWDLAAWHLPFIKAPFVPQSAPVCPPPGEAHTEAQFLADLSGRLGRPLFGFSWLAKFWGSYALNHWLPIFLHTLFWYWRRKWQNLPSIPIPQPKPHSYLARAKKLNFWPINLTAEIERLENNSSRTALPPNTFLLIGRRQRRGQNSWLQGGVYGGQPEDVAWLAPETMANLNLKKGDMIEISGPAGLLCIPVAPHHSVNTQIIVVPHGLPGLNVNQIHPTWIEPISGMNQLQGLPVQIRKIGHS